MGMTATCRVILTISICIFIGTLIWSITLKVRSMRSARANAKRSLFTPFSIFAIGFFVATTIMAYPVYYYGGFADSEGFTRFFKTVMISVLNTFQMFFLNADFSKVTEVINDSTLQNNLASAYVAYFAILYVLAPILTFGFILSFFKDIWARLKYTLYTASDIYIFSEINERSLALAKDVMRGRKGRKLIVFAGAYGGEESDREKTLSLIDEAKKFGAVCLKNDINLIKLKRARKGYTRKFYLMSEDEDQNLKQALELIGRCKDMPNYNNYETQFFVFANGAESEVFLDSIDNGNMKVRRITEYWNAMLNMLRKYPIFDSAVPKADNAEVKEINMLVVGAGNYGTELIKTVCWLGQMPGYELNIKVFDASDAEDKFKTIAPEFIKMNGKKIDGEPYYNISFNQVDVNSGAFSDELAKIGQVTYAFVALGDDELNVETAVKIRTYFGRAKINSGNEIPPIYTIIFNGVKSEIFQQYGGLKSIAGKAYNIEFIDGISSHYTLEVIEREELEKAGLNCHLKWATTETDRLDAMKKYEKYEYYRKSSIAESAHRAAMIELGLYALDKDGGVGDEIAKCEHNRWSAYMRSEGYVYGEVKDDIAKTHYDLVPFGKLTKSEWKKDKNIKC